MKVSPGECFLRLPIKEQARIFEAALCLFFVRLALGLLSFPHALRLLGIIPGETSAGRLPTAEAAEIGRAIARASRYVPFRAVCLQQAFAAALMLRRRGLAATMHFGLARGSDPASLTAHAWSRCGDVPVTGAKDACEFTEVAVFRA